MDGRVEKALRWFDAQGVDAVMVPGDIAHSGKIPELVHFATVWDRVFPNGRGSGGQPVEKLFVTGNHDLDAWWVKGDAAWRTENVFNHGDNPQKVWPRLFHEDFLPIWKKKVKCRKVADPNAANLRCQHAHLRSDGALAVVNNDV